MTYIAEVFAGDGDLIPPMGHLMRRMGEMREWLDHRRLETATFYCRQEAEGGILICVGFKIESEAAAFVQQFGGRISGWREPSRLNSAAAARL